MNSKKLFEILDKSLIVRSEGSLEQSVTNLAFDSRSVDSQGLFFAVKGELADGHRFIDAAIENGAVAIVCEEFPDVIIPACTYVLVDDVRKVLALSSNLFFGSPSRQLKLIGITGTNGKTTTCTLLHQLFENMNFKSGLISTVKYAYPGFSEDSSHTTPDPIKLNHLLAQMVDAQCEYVFMEVSSHALDQQRTEGIFFSGGVFTNLSHDHLDYHNTFKSYLNCKKSFFDGLSKNAFAIYNEDDKNGKVMVQNCAASKIGYSLYSLAGVKGKILSNSIEGLQLIINDQEVFTRLVGKYNAYNIMAAYAVAIELEVDRDDVLLGLSTLKGAEGRFELLKGTKKKVYGIVDYAHTPDALEKILSTLVELRKKETRLITVIGCGGNRDVVKRPKMAYIASTLSDQVLITSDNPRNEKPDDILDDMEKGLEGLEDNVIRIVDRRQAIKTAVVLAKDEDIILVAGKGHEKYQDINGVKSPFDDIEELKKLLF